MEQELIWTIVSFIYPVILVLSMMWIIVRLVDNKPIIPKFTLSRLRLILGEQKRYSKKTLERLR